MMTMSRAVNVPDLEDHLSDYLEAVQNGEEIIIYRGNVPFAKLEAIPLRRNRTQLGFDRGRIKINGDITGPATPERG